MASHAGCPVGVSVTCAAGDSAKAVLVAAPVVRPIWLHGITSDPATHCTMPD